jgi:hypothetical protein
MPGGIARRRTKEEDTADAELLAQQIGALVGQTAGLVL